MPNPRGDKGRDGPPGKSGPRGIKGIKGQQGLVGMKGERGAFGIKGERGIVGNKGRKGEKGESAKGSQASVVPQTNWKQCVWKSGSGTDNEKIKVIRIRIINNTLQTKVIRFYIKIFLPSHCLRTHYINN